MSGQMLGHIPEVNAALSSFDGPVVSGDLPFNVSGTPATTSLQGRKNMQRVAADLETYAAQVCRIIGI